LILASALALSPEAIWEIGLTNDIIGATIVISSESLNQNSLRKCGNNER